MRINQNISALNAYRNLVGTDNRLNKSLERLSSGLRINRAADDAAGLAISEKMRGQIRGLNQAVRNAQDGISLIQTAEGALNETHSILQRMRELSVQAASDTLTSSDRMEIQKEITQLTQEIDRIANTTEFNTKKLLDGTTSALTSTSDLKTKVFMRDGLRTIDQFGQKAVGGGNYKLEITATPGEGQVQKTDIMKIKHGTEYNFDPDSGITAFSAEKLRYGDYIVESEVTDTVVDGTDNEITTLFAGSETDLVATGSNPGDIELTGTFGIKITGVDVATETITFDVIYRFYDADGVLQVEGIDSGETLVVDGSGNNEDYDVGGSGITVDFHSDDIFDYKVGESGVFAASFGNGTGDDIVLDHVHMSTGEYSVDINGETYTAEDAQSTISLYSGSWNSTVTEFEMVQMDANNNFLVGTVKVTVDTLDDAAEAVSFDFQGEVGQVSTLDTQLKDIDRFWDASGNFLVSSPQTITLVQGDGNKTSFTIFGTDTLKDVTDKLNQAVHHGLGQNEVNSEDVNAYAWYVGTADDTSEFFTVEGTFIIQSAVTGKDGEISFVGDDAVINALSLTTIQQSTESLYTVNVTDAHEGTVVAENVKISGNMLVGTVHANVDVKFDAMAGVELSVTDGVFGWAGGSANATETFVHLADNTQVFHIGANPLQDIGASIADMRAEALGVDNILVTNRGAANQAIATIDSAIGRVSGERSKMGALQNRLEHTINNLGVAAENLTAAESRIRDLDFAMEMIEFTRNQIMMQAGTAMLAQANMKPQTVLMLIG